MVVGFRQYQKNLSLHLVYQGRRVVATAFESPDFDLTVLPDREESIRDRNILVLLRRKEDNVSVNRLYRQRKVRSLFDFLGKLLEIFVCCAFSPHINGINDCVDQIEATTLGNFFRYKQRFPRHSVYGFVGLDLSKPRILIARVSETTDEEPFQRVTLQLESRCDSRFRRLLKCLQLRALGNQAFDHAARDTSSLLADAISQLRYAGCIRAARTINRFGRDIEMRHDAWELADKI